MSQNYSDAELVDLYKASKDTAHLTVLFTRHSDIAYRSALRIMKNAPDAEDILQTSYCKMIRDLHLYKGTGSVLGWMLQVIIHTCYKQKQSEKSRQNREKIIMSERPQMANPKNNELSEMMENHLNKLPEIYKAPITLQIMEGLSIKEVSQVLEIPEKTIRSQIARGLEKLKVSLENVGFTASVVSIGDLLKEVQMPMAPAAIKTSSYFNSIFQNKAASSTRLVASSGAKITVIQKTMAIFLLLGVSIGVIFYWNKPSRFIETNSGVNEKWDFENTSDLAMYHDMGLVHGGITLVKSVGVDKSNGLVIEADSLLELNISKFQLPIKISYKIDLLKASAGLGQLFLKGNYHPGKNLYHLTNLREIIPLPSVSDNLNSSLGFIGKWFSQTAYISENCIDFWVDGKRAQLLIGSSPENKKIYFYVKGQIIIDDLMIESIEQKDLPNKADCENQISNIKFKEGVDIYSLDKEKLGINKNSEVKPMLAVIQKEKLEKIVGINGEVLFPRIGEKNSVEWTKERQKIVKKWSFENEEDLANFKVIRGEVFISKKNGVDGSNCLSVSPEAIIEFDISGYQMPIKITQTFDNILPPGLVSKGILVVKSNYDVQKNIFNFTALNKVQGIDVSESAKKNKNENVKAGYFGEWYSRTIYVSDDCIESLIFGKRSSILFGTSYDNKKLYFNIKDQALIDNFVIESISPSEVPDHVAFKKFVSSIPFKIGSGSYPLENDKTNLKIEPDCPAALGIYDKISFENGLGFRNKLPTKIEPKENTTPSK